MENKKLTKNQKITNDLLGALATLDRARFDLFTIMNFVINRDATINIDGLKSHVLNVFNFGQEILGKIVKKEQLNETKNKTADLPQDGGKSE